MICRPFEAIVAVGIGRTVAGSRQVRTRDVHERDTIGGSGGGGGRAAGCSRRPHGQTDARDARERLVAAHLCVRFGLGEVGRFVVVVVVVIVVDVVTVPPLDILF